MSNVDSTLLLQGLATIAWGTAGISLSTRSGTGESGTDRVLGCGLLVGAALLGLDTMTAGSAPMPLSSWALLACSAFALLPNRDSALHEIGACSWRRTLAAVGVFLLLHWLHHVAPVQPEFAWSTGFGDAMLRPLDLLAATALGWLALRHDPRLQETSSLATAQQRLLFGAPAAGLLLASLGTAGADEFTALGQIAAVVPMLWQGVHNGDRRVVLAMATALAAVTALGLRAATFATPSLGDPLLAIAAMFLAFGTAAAGTMSSLLEPRSATATPPGPSAADLQPPHAPMNSPNTPRPHGTPADALSMRTLGTDLRAPLTSMLAAADLLGEATSKRERESHLATIHDQGQRLAATLADLEDFERLLRGELEFADDTFGLVDLLDATVSHAATFATARGIEVRRDLATDLPRWVKGDPTRVRQLTSRLIDLCVQRSSIGHVDVAVSSDAAGIQVLVQNASAATRLATHDGGAPGGGPFQDGIALAFSRQLALAMGGELQESQREDGGILLRLTLPLSAAPEWEADIAAEDASRPAAPTAQPAPVSGHVLLVDDSRDHQRLLGHLLHRTGAQVTTAENGEIALHLLQEQAFDLVLMDMQMPEMDGTTATRELRKRGITTPVLALTADSGEMAVAECLAAGCNGHMAKPVDREVLQRMLAMYLPAAKAH